MPSEWTAVCKDCGKTFAYSDYVHKERLRRGLSAPERCLDHRKVHSLETRSIGASHFGLTPLQEVSILGGRYLGSFDRGDRLRPSLQEIEANPMELDLGLKDENVQEIYDALDGHKVLVIVAPTGAGKST